MVYHPLNIFVHSRNTLYTGNSSVKNILKVPINEWWITHREEAWWWSKFILFGINFTPEIVEYILRYASKDLIFDIPAQVLWKFYKFFWYQWYRFIFCHILFFNLINENQTITVHQPKMDEEGLLFIYFCSFSLNWKSFAQLDTN